jgi:hypothetical protein
LECTFGIGSPPVFIVGDLGDKYYHTALFVEMADEEKRSNIMVSNWGFLISMIKAFDSFDQIYKVLTSMNLHQNILFCLSILRDEKKLKLWFVCADNFHGQHN